MDVRGGEWQDNDSQVGAYTRDWKIVPVSPRGKQEKCRFGFGRWQPEYHVATWRVKRPWDNKVEQKRKQYPAWALCFLCVGCVNLPKIPTGKVLAKMGWAFWWQQRAQQSHLLKTTVFYF